MTKHLYGIALAGALWTIPLAAHAQPNANRAPSSPPPSRPAAPSSPDLARHRAFVLNVGPMIGYLGGVYVRINPEFQLHREREHRFGGHAFNIGLAVTFWPDEGGPSFAVAPRWQYDHQLVAGTNFFVSPYLGLDVGLGVFNVFGEGSEPRLRFVATPIGGVDLKVLIGRLVLGFRPVGISVPFIIGDENPPVRATAIWDIAGTIGATF